MLRNVNVRSANDELKIGDVDNIIVQRRGNLALCLWSRYQLAVTDPQPHHEWYEEADLGWDWDRLWRQDETSEEEWRELLSKVTQIRRGYLQWEGPIGSIYSPGLSWSLQETGALPEGLARPDRVRVGCWTTACQQSCEGHSAHYVGECWYGTSSVPGICLGVSARIVRSGSASRRALVEVPYHVIDLEGFWIDGRCVEVSDE